MSSTPPPPPPAPEPSRDPSGGPSAPVPGHDPAVPDQHPLPPREAPDPAWPATTARHDAGDPDEAFPARVEVVDAVLVLSWTFVAQLLVGAVAATVGVDLEGLSDQGRIALVIVIQVVTLLGLLAWLRRRRIALWRVLGPVRPAFKHVAMGIGLGLTGLLLVQTVAAVVVSLLPDAQPPSQALLEAEGGVWIVVGQAVVACLLAPVIEEVTYRGVVFQAARSRVGLVGGLVVSALVFTAMHVEVWNSAPALFGLLILGLWLAAIFHRTGSLVVPIVAHATFNGVTLALATLVPPVS